MDSDERQLVTTMPLHAITSTYGEAGPAGTVRGRDRVLARAGPARLNRALDLAARLHAADRREREPYVNHLLRVAIRIMSHYGVRDADVACAALLHDAVEDHAAELSGGGGQEAALAALAAEFGPRVAELVGAVTNPPYAPGRDPHEQYREHVAQSLRGNPWARVIKASDFTDNGVGLIHTTGPRLRKLAGKYAPLVPVLRELIALPDTPLDARGPGAYPGPARPGRGPVRRRPGVRPGPARRVLSPALAWRGRVALPGAGQAFPHAQRPGMVGAVQLLAVRQGLLEQRDRLRDPARLPVGGGQVVPRGQGARVAGAQRRSLVARICSTSGIASAIRPASR